MTSPTNEGTSADERVQWKLYMQDSDTDADTFTLRLIAQVDSLKTERDDAVRLLQEASMVAYIASGRLRWYKKASHGDNAKKSLDKLVQQINTFTQSLTKEKP